jgi:rhodanese-related sulfurtransferase
MKSEFSIPRPVMRRITIQIASLAGLSLGVGLLFNASNPIGIRWSGLATLNEKASPGASAAALTKAPVAAPVAAGPAVTAASPAPIPLPDLATFTNLSSVEWTVVKPLAAAVKVIVVDVRGRPTYDAGHIPGATSLPEWSTADEVSAFQQKYNTNTPLILYCGNLSCPASDEMAKKLVEEFGYAKVLVMKGGYAEWQKAELGYDPTPTRTTWAETKPLIESGQAVLVDARPKATYDAAHIPGAISLPEANPEEAFREFQKQHPADKPVVVYCSDLKCSASMRVAIKLVTWYNFQKVQFMPGGFQEWQQTELAQVKPHS